MSDNRVAIYMFDENTPKEEFRALFYPEECDFKRFEKSLNSRIVYLPEDVLSVEDIRKFIIENSKGE